MIEERSPARKLPCQPAPWRPYIAAFALTGVAWTLDFYGWVLILPCVLAVVGFSFAVVGAMRHAVGVGFNWHKPAGLLATVIIGIGNLVLFYMLIGLFLAALTPVRTVDRLF